MFADRNVFAEAALEKLAAALGIEHAHLATGYDYLTREGVPASAIRVRGIRTKRPAWEKRLDGPPRFVSQWERHGMDAPEQPPQTFLEGQPVHAKAQLTNQGGPAKGLRVEIAATGDSIELDRIEVIIHLPGKFQMAGYPSPLVRAGDLLVAELPDAALMPGVPAGLSLHEAPMDAMMDAHHAGNIHLNIHGRTCRDGRTDLAVRCIPLANPAAAYVAPVAINVQPVRGAPLRARDELYPHMLEPLTADDTYLLVVFDAPASAARTHAMHVLEALRPVWPKGAWEVFRSDAQFEQSTRLKARGDLRDLKVWNTLSKAITSAKHGVTATCGESSGFAVELETELPQVALAKGKVSAARAAEILIPIVDDLAKSGAVAQAVLAPWQARGLPSTITPYESVVGIDDEHAARRAWATRWVRAVGRGQLWLGPALADRAAALPLPGAVAFGPARRIPVEDVATTEQILAPLLPSGDDFHAFIRTIDD